jgi:hypothetical protein
MHEDETYIQTYRKFKPRILMIGPRLRGVAQLLIWGPCVIFAVLLQLPRAQG